MKILFTTDIHGDMETYQAFSEKLKDFDIGIIAGDLMEEFLSPNDAIAFGLKDKELIEELHGEEFDEVVEMDKAIKNALHNKNSTNRKGLEIKRKKIIETLEIAQRPIYYIRGNHDIADWGDTKYIKNIENKKIDLGTISLFGLKEDFRLAVSQFRYSSKIANCIDKGTILVCHSPPYKIMDITKMVRRRDHKVVLTHVGSKNILKIVNKKHPLFCLCGHVHQGIGINGNIINGGCYRHKKFASIDTEKSKAEFINW